MFVHCRTIEIIFIKWCKIVFQAIQDEGGLQGGLTAQQHHQLSTLRRDASLAGRAHGTDSGQPVGMAINFEVFPTTCSCVTDEPNTLKTFLALKDVNGNVSNNMEDAVIWDGEKLHGAIQLS